MCAMVDQPDDISEGCIVTVSIILCLVKFSLILGELLFVFRSKLHFFHQR